MVAMWIVVWIAVRRNRVGEWMGRWASGWRRGSCACPTAAPATAFGGCPSRRTRSDDVGHTCKGSNRSCGCSRARMSSY